MRGLLFATLDLLIDTLNGTGTFCSGGTYTFSPSLPVSLTTATSFALTFTDCFTGPTGTINGNLTVTLDGVTGDPKLQDYTLQTTLIAINLTIVDTVGTSTMTGGMRNRQLRSFRSSFPAFLLLSVHLSMML